MGCLRQAAVRRPRTCFALPGPLYASRSDLQPSHLERHRYRGFVSLERLQAPQQASRDDAFPRRVLAPLFAARSTSGLPSNPLLRLSRQSAAQSVIAPVPQFSGRSFSTIRPCEHGTYGGSLLSTLPRAHADHSAANRL